jgi:hypothetical protein
VTALFDNFLETRDGGSHGVGLVHRTACQLFHYRHICGNRTTLKEIGFYRWYLCNSIGAKSCQKSIYFENEVDRISENGQLIKNQRFRVHFMICLDTRSCKVAIKLLNNFIIELHNLFEDKVDELSVNGQRIRTQRARLYLAQYSLHKFSQRKYFSQQLSHFFLETIA